MYQYIVEMFFGLEYRKIQRHYRLVKANSTILNLSRLLMVLYIWQIKSCPQNKKPQSLRACV